MPLSVYVKALKVDSTNRYKQNVEEARKLAQSSKSGGIEPYPKEFMAHLNGLVMDIVNCVWRNKGFSCVDNSMGCNIRQ